MTVAKHPAGLHQNFKRLRIKGCQYCHGDLFWVEDYLESYWECLQCSKHQGIVDAFAALPKRDKRWRISLEYLGNLGKVGER